MKIDVLGWYNGTNVGDEAFRVVLSEVLKDHSVQFICPPNTHNNPDIVILGGGNVVSPFYLDILPNCPRYALGVGFGYESEIDLISKCNFLWVMARNATDVQAMANKLKCPSKSIPDLAFALTPDQTKRNSKTIGVFLTDYINPAIDRLDEKFFKRSIDFKINISKKLDELIDNGWEVVLLPCSTGGYGDDRRINLDVKAFMRHKSEIIMDRISPQDMINLISSFNFTICMRFHSHIFSIIAGTPFISIDFTRKTSLLLKEYNLLETQCVKFYENKVDFSNFDNAVSEISKLTDYYQTKFYNISSQAKIELTEVFKTIHQYWLSK